MATRCWFRWLRISCQAAVLLLGAAALRAAESGKAAAAPDAGIRFLEERVRADPDDFLAHNQLVARYLNKLRQTGDYAWLPTARRAAETSLAAVPAEQNTGGLVGLARVQLAAHRFEDAIGSAKKLGNLAPGKSASYAVLGDALLEFGETAEARGAYEKMRSLDPESVETLSRLARFAELSGDFALARDQLMAALASAQQLSPAAPETVAWCEVRLGALAFSSGDWDEAAKRYEAALVAFPGYYAALDHVAELHGARGEFRRARELYESLAQRLPRPEYYQAIGDLFVFSGEPDAARPWHDRALEGYLRSVETGDVHYLHHLATFFADVREDPAAAVKYARRDLELRNGAAAHEVLGWALFRSGEFAAASAEMEQALGAGARSAHLFHYAGMVFSAAGQFERGQKLMREALVLNPRYHAFHVHR